MSALMMAPAGPFTEAAPGVFGEILDQHIVAKGLSRHAVALRCGVNPSYVQRIVQGQREPPRQHIVEAMARTLRLSAAQAAAFHIAAGYCPPPMIQAAGYASDSIGHIIAVLTDPTLSDDDRAAFIATVGEIAARWRAK